VSATQTTPASGDQRKAVDILLEHHDIAVSDARCAMHDDTQHAAVRLLEASQLLRLAARELDREIEPTG
jgi:hypothetical protein